VNRQLKGRIGVCAPYGPATSRSNAAGSLRRAAASSSDSGGAFTSSIQTIISMNVAKA
jgi:hypothetical protein